MTHTIMLLTMALTIAPATADAQSKSLSAPRTYGPYSGFIELSTSPASPIVALTVDVQSPAGSRDELVDVLFLTQLLPSMPKPPALRSAGTVAYLDDGRSVVVKTSEGTLYFLVGSAKASEPNRYSAAVVDVIVSTRRAEGVPQRGHAETVKPFLQMSELPFRR